MKENIKLEFGHRYFTQMPTWIPEEAKNEKPAKNEKAHEGKKVAAKAAAAAAAAGDTKDSFAMGALITQERAALKAAMKAVQRYKNGLARVQKVASEEEAADEELRKASAAVADATTSLGEAKGMRVAAAQFDLKTSPLSEEHQESRTRLAHAEATVVAAQKTLKAASRAARVAGDKAEKVEARAAKAAVTQARLELEMKQSKSEVERISGEVAREETELKTALASLRKLEDTVDAAVEKELPKSSKNLGDGSSEAGSKAESKH